MPTDNPADLAELIAWARRHNISKLDNRREVLAAKTSLNLFRCDLTALPEALACLQSLQRLDLRCNPLEQLPQRIGELRQLKMLDIGEGRLTTLPDSMAGLHRLERLDLHGNRLTELPEWIGDLPSLVWLDVRGNPLTKVPASLGQSKTLRHLAYDDTVVDPPQLACLQNMANRPLSALQATFEKFFSHLNYQLPEADVLHRRRGQIGGEDGDFGYGHTVTYLFDKDAHGEYLDFYMSHRIAGDDHIRIYEDGSWENLDVISPFGPRISDDPVENERFRKGDQQEVERIRAILRAKGFSSSY